MATERLSRLPGGRVLYRFKHAWRDGSTHGLFEPLEVLEKLAALVPPPRFNLVRYHGVLAPAAHWRPHIVRTPWPKPIPLLIPAVERTRQPEAIPARSSGFPGGRGFPGSNPAAHGPVTTPGPS